MSYIEKQQSAIYEVAVLDFEDAVVLETMQNIERDVRMELEDVNHSTQLWDVYESEARHVLELYGFGYDPEYNSLEILGQMTLLPTNLLVDMFLHWVHQFHYLIYLQKRVPNP